MRDGIFLDFSYKYKYIFFLNPIRNKILWFQDEFQQNRSCDKVEYVLWLIELIFVGQVTVSTTSTCRMQMRNQAVVSYLSIHVNHIGCYTSIVLWAYANNRVWSHLAKAVHNPNCVQWLHSAHACAVSDTRVCSEQHTRANRATHTYSASNTHVLSEQDTPAHRATHTCSASNKHDTAEDAPLLSTFVPGIDLLGDKLHMLQSW